MPYNVERMKEDGSWEVLYTEDDALKADLLMMGLSVVVPIRGAQYIDSYGVRVHWVSAAEQHAEQHADASMSGGANEGRG